MRALWLLLTVGCTSIRPLADLADPRLRTPDHAGGFVVHHERLDPNTVFRFGDAHGRWSRGIAGHQLRVDRDGAWTDTFVHPWDAADAVRIAGMPEIAAESIERVRPVGALLERDGEAYVLSGPRPTLERWLRELELAVARLEPEETVSIDDPRHPGTTRLLDNDDAKLYQLRERERGATLGTWSFSAKGGPWQGEISGIELVDFVDLGRRVRVGWKWADIAHANVENINGGKTLVGLVLVSAAAVSFAGLGAIANGAGLPAPHAPAIPAGGGAAVDPSWKPDLAPATSASAPHLFTTGARVRAIIRPIVTLDAATTLHRDLTSSGVSARIRFMDIFEIGGGARETIANGHRQITGMFQTGLHVPLDAAFHYAVPLGVEVGGGGDVAIEVRVPWGVRFQTGRWLATLLPASPQYLHVDGQPRRWSLASGVELGATF